MLIKKEGHLGSIIKPFDLLGNDETALAKAFSFILANDSNSLFTFLQFLGIKIKNTKNNLKNISIIIEKKRSEGRTDIEIRDNSKFHVIIECKINKNRVKEQRTQYLTSFDKNNNQNILCFITQERDANKQLLQKENIKIINLSWLDIIELLNNKFLIQCDIVKEFLRFSLRNYKMNTLKEVLIQDLSDATEMKRFKNYHIYKRDETFGTPLYFAPYFTKKANQEEGEGISYISKVLGVLTLNPKDIDLLEDDLNQFSNDVKLISAWKEGVKLGLTQNEDHIFTYYFLKEPVKISKPLLKDGGIQKGRGKDWIAAAIPKNRNVTFEEFIKRALAQHA